MRVIVVYRDKVRLAEVCVHDSWEESNDKDFNAAICMAIRQPNTPRKKYHECRDYYQIEEVCH